MTLGGNDINMEKKFKYYFGEIRRKQFMEMEMGNELKFLVRWVSRGEQKEVFHTIVTYQTLLPIKFY